MNNDKLFVLNAYFDEWNEYVNRAEALIRQEEYFLEGLLVLSCYIDALGRLRYPNVTKDWKRYKTIVSEYSGQTDVFKNIDLLFFYQWPSSEIANDKEYETFELTKSK